MTVTRSQTCEPCIFRGRVEISALIEIRKNDARKNWNLVTGNNRQLPKHVAHFIFLLFYELMRVLEG